MIRLNNEEFEETLSHALSREWGPNKTSFDYSKPYNVIAYCSERISQIPFQISFKLTDEDKQRIGEKLAFFNGVIGRVSSLEGKTRESSSHSEFGEENNQVDEFLVKIGYKIQQ